MSDRAYASALQSKTVHFTAQTADFQALEADDGLVWQGWRLEETAGAGARVRFRHGTTDTSPVLGSVYLAANGNDADSAVPGNQGPRLVPNGLFVEVVTGTVSLAVAHLPGSAGGLSGGGPGPQNPPAADGPAS